MKILGEINQHYNANMTSAELIAQKDADRLPELFEASGMEILNWNRRPSTLCAEISIACKNQRAPPLTFTEPENSVMESCRWFLNINRGWRCCYLQKLGDQVGQDIKSEDEAYLGTKRPLKGWDATAYVKLLANPKHTNDLLSGHFLQKQVAVVNDSLVVLGAFMLKKELSDDDVNAFEKAATLLGVTWKCFFSTKERCEEACQELGLSLPPPGATFINFHPGSYEHHTISQAVPFVRKHKSFIKYSLWGCEALNKVWKPLLLEYMTNGGGCQEFDPGYSGDAFVRSHTLVDPQGAENEECVKLAEQPRVRPAVMGAGTAPRSDAGDHARWQEALYACAECGQEAAAEQSSACAAQVELLASALEEARRRLEDEEDAAGCAEVLGSALVSTVWSSAGCEAAMCPFHGLCLAAFSVMKTALSLSGCSVLADEARRRLQEDADGEERCLTEAAYARRAAVYAVLRAEAAQFMVDLGEFGVCAGACMFWADAGAACLTAMLASDAMAATVQHEQ
eukprot:gene9683-11479_t